MQKRYPCLLLGTIVLLSAVAGVGRHALAVTFSEFTIPTANSGPNDITAGPATDGALWFTEAQANKIGRVTTSGTTTEFTILTASSTPFNITLGPDGALWFTESVANHIGRITTAGTTTDIVVPTPTN